MSGESVSHQDVSVRFRTAVSDHSGRVQAGHNKARGTGNIVNMGVIAMKARMNKTAAAVMIGVGLLGAPSFASAQHYDQGYYGGHGYGGRGYGHGGYGLGGHGYNGRRGYGSQDYGGHGYGRRAYGGHGYGRGYGYFGGYGYGGGHQGHHWGY